MADAGDRHRVPAGDGAVFIDKDGTLLVNRPYDSSPQRMRWLPGAARGVSLLGRSGIRMFVVSNQAGVALGKFREARLQQVALRLRVMFAARGARLGGFLYCPHHPAGKVAPHVRHCRCRKPGDGMLRRVARRRHVRLEASWMVGDILDDIEAGRRCGCRTVLVDNGGETVWRAGPLREPEAVVGDFGAAARLIAEAVRSAGCGREGGAGAWSAA